PRRVHHPGGGGVLGLRDPALLLPPHPPRPRHRRSSRLPHDSQRRRSPPRPPRHRAHPPPRQPPPPLTTTVHKRHTPRRCANVTKTRTRGPATDAPRDPKQGRTAPPPMRPGTQSKDARPSLPSAMIAVNVRPTTASGHIRHTNSDVDPTST